MSAVWQSAWRFFGVFRKTLREMWRDWLVLSLSVAFAPLFVWAYYLFTLGGSTSYNVLVINLDQGAMTPQGIRVVLSDEAIAAMEGVSYKDGQPIVKVIRLASQAEAEQKLRDRAAAAFVTLPPDFTETLLALQSGDHSHPVNITFGGDLTNPYYAVASVLAMSGMEAYVQQMTGQQSLIQYDEQPLGGSGVRTEFEIYTPGVFVFAIIMLIFMASMIVAHEVEAGTLRRLRLTPLTSFELLGGMTVALILVGLASELLALGTAIALGFRSQGPFWVAILVGVMTSLSVVGMGLIVACFSRTVSQAFVIANFPLGLFMFFTGAIFPVPKVTLFKVGEHAIGLYDILPPTHAVAALNKVFTLGAGFQEVAFELGMLTILSVVYFAVGVWLFQRMHLR
jgi:ABC-2 type transport system permease protein